MNNDVEMKKIDYNRYIILLIIAAALLRFFLAFIVHPSGDGAWIAVATRFIAQNHRLPLFELVGRPEPFWHAPLFHIISAFFYILFGDIGIKLTSPLFGSLSLILTFLIAKKLFNEKIAFYATLFLAFIPIHIYQSSIPLTDSITTFFALLSIFLVMENRYFFSAISTGLLLLAKQTGIFLIPLLIFLIYIKIKDKKIFLAKTFLFLLIAVLVCSPWYMRQAVNLGNPVYPYLNNFFKGYTKEGIFPLQSINPANLLNVKYIVSSGYLDSFGVPNGDIRTLSFLSLPFLNLLLFLWLVVTLIFSLPVIIGITRFHIKKNQSKILVFWIIPYLVFITVLLMHFPMMNARYILPIFPALGMIWAHGVIKLEQKVPKKIILSFILLFIITFAASETIKTITATNAWKFYQKDFDWINANIPNNATVFMYWKGQTLAYNIKQKVDFVGIGEWSLSNLSAGSYIFVNQDFKLDPLVFPENEYDYIKNNPDFEIIYSNTKTSTQVYLVNPLLKNS